MTNEEKAMFLQGLNVRNELLPGLDKSRYNEGLTHGLVEALAIMGYSVQWDESGKATDILLLGAMARAKYAAH